jgi:hypothetical protein
LPRFQLISNADRSSSVLAQWIFCVIPMETARASAAPACTTNAGIVTDILTPTKTRDCRSIPSATASTTYTNRLRLRASSSALSARATDGSAKCFRCGTATNLLESQTSVSTISQFLRLGRFYEMAERWCCKFKAIHLNPYSVAARIAPCSQIVWFIFYLMSGQGIFWPF